MGGISTDTGGALIYGTDAYLTVNDVDLGATEGDIEIAMETEEYYPDLMQARGPVSGTGKIINATGRITVTMVEWKYAVLSAMYSLGYSSNADSEMLGSGSVGMITEVDNVVVTGAVRNDGKAFKATIAKARVSSPLAITLMEKENSKLEVTFDALYTLNSPATFPMWIEFEV